MRVEAVISDPRLPFAHGSCLAETGEGLIAVWFAGRYESHESTAIWSARRRKGGWSAPRQIAKPTGEACWNPVLHHGDDGMLTLFFRTGEDPTCWRGWTSRSIDQGERWSPPQPLPDGILGPIRSRPLPRADGTLLSPSSREGFRSGRTDWRVVIERWTPAADLWTAAAPIADPERLGAIQPSVLDWGDGRLQALCRTRRGVVGAAWSEDDGASWGALTATRLRNPNSAVDAARLPDGRAALALNPSAAARSPLILAFSEDGISWRSGPTLAAGAGDFAYPSLCPLRKGGVAVSWTEHGRGIVCALLDAAALA